MNVWRHALQRQRIIILRSKGYREQAATDAAKTAESAEKSERYCVLVDGCQVLSKYLRVNRESREETLVFYRVHLPCSFTGKGTTNPGTFQFNPEYNFFFIRAEWPAMHTSIDLLYRLKNTYDPCHVGLLNLAIDLNSINGNGLDMVQPSDLNYTRSFLSQLHELDVKLIDGPAGC